jgi:hypothetical protein
MNQVLGVGVDVGTSRIVCCRSDSESPSSVSADLNAFIEIPRSIAVETSLRKRQVPFFNDKDKLFVSGGWSLTFAELFHAEMRRPMQSGVVNPNEPTSIDVMSSIFGRLLGPSQANSEPLVFSVPSPSIDTADLPSSAQLTNHESVLTALFTRMGYRASAVKEGDALIYAECQDSEFSGVGISFGAGLCNVALTYLAVPVLDFSIPRGGDFIDSSAATVLGEKASRVRVMKEQSFSFASPSTDPVTRTVRVFYEELIRTVIEKLVQVFTLSPDIPHLGESIPLVLGGGGALPQGFRGVFAAALQQHQLPIRISEVRLARDPLNAVARGSLAYARVNSGAGVP